MPPLHFFHSFLHFLAKSYPNKNPVEFGINFSGNWFEKYNLSNPNPLINKPRFFETQKNNKNSDDLHGINCRHSERLLQCFFTCRTHTIILRKIGIFYIFLYCYNYSHCDFEIMGLQQFNGNIWLIWKWADFCQFFYCYLDYIWCSNTRWNFTLYEFWVIETNSLKFYMHFWDLHIGKKTRAELKNRKFPFGRRLNLNRDCSQGSKNKILKIFKL